MVPAQQRAFLVWIEVLDLELMISIAKQMMTAPKVQIRGKSIPVRRTSAFEELRFTWTTASTF